MPTRRLGAGSHAMYGKSPKMTRRDHHHNGKSTAGSSASAAPRKIHSAARKLRGVKL